jgi:hypothetical protein
LKSLYLVHKFVERGSDTLLAFALREVARVLSDYSQTYGETIVRIAIGKHRHTLHLPVPFATQDGPRPNVGRTPAQVHRVLAGFLWKLRAIEQALTIAIQVPQDIGLKPVSQHAEQEMARQVRVGGGQTGSLAVGGDCPGRC